MQFPGHSRGVAGLAQPTKASKAIILFRKEETGVVPGMLIALNFANVCLECATGHGKALRYALVSGALLTRQVI